MQHVPSPFLTYLRILTSSTTHFSTYIPSPPFSNSLAHALTKHKTHNHPHRTNHTNCTRNHTTYNRPWCTLDLPHVLQHHPSTTLTSHHTTTPLIKTRNEPSYHNIIFTSRQVILKYTYRLTKILQRQKI